MTPAQYRALGLSARPKGTVKVIKPRAKRAVSAPWHTRCVTCGTECNGEKAQTDHLADTGHPRYESELERNDPCPQ